MTKLEAIAASKTFRKDADELLQRMKAHKQQLISTTKMSTAVVGELLLDPGEAIAQHVLSIRDLESAVMRQGMALKYIGNPDPYPVSKKDPMDIAKDLYAAYWEDLLRDPTKGGVINGWLAAALVHPATHRVEPTSDGLKL